MSSIFFECGCHDDEHRIHFSLNEEEPEGFPEICTSVFLNDYDSFWKRIGKAVKYVFGYKCKYGHWDCWQMRPEDVESLQKMCTEYIAALDKFRERNSNWVPPSREDYNISWSSQ